MSTAITPSVFGNVHLGYVVIETNKFADWKRFGRDAIGMHLDDMSLDTIRFRLDANECRFLLRRGPAEDVIALGWHLDDHATFDEISRRVADHGVPAVEGSDEDAKLRGVERFLRFPGPNGLTQEIYTTVRTAPLPLDIAGARVRHRRRRTRPRGAHHQEAAPGARLLQPRLRRATVRLHR
jgi:hypothetical protein